MTRIPDDQPDRPDHARDLSSTAGIPAPEAAQEALARLRAADPATGVVAPDHARLRAEVDRRRSEPETTDPIALAGGTAAIVAGDDVAVSRAARRSPAGWLRVAATVAAFALVGGGSFALGRGGGSDAPAQDAIALSGGGSPEAASLAKLPAGDADMRVSPWFGGRTVFTASGLSDDPSEATAWGFDAASVFSAETAARIAGVLGVSGTPELQDWGAWTVGAQDGSAATVSLQPDGLASFSYSDPARDPWSCGISVQPVPADGAASDGAAAEPGASDCPTDQAPGPADDDAVASAQAVLRSLGVDPAAYEFIVEDSGSEAVTSVTAALVLDGQRSGLTWNTSFVADGLQSVFGALAPVVDLGTYPVIGAASAVSRLTDPRFGSTGGGVMPLAAADVAKGAAPSVAETVAPDSSTSMIAPAATVPPTPTPGGAIPWPVTQVTLTSARLGVSLTTTAAGASLLVPAYEFADAEGSTWSVIAVAEDRMDFSAAG